MCLNRGYSHLIKWCLVGTILLLYRLLPTAYCLVGCYCSLLGSFVSAKSTDSLVDISTRLLISTTDKADYLL